MVASRGRANARRRAAQRLNPLHCGAVVASPSGSRRQRCSLPESQSPSLRGSGRFLCERLNKAHAQLSLNPLHCGAVVASVGFAFWKYEAYESQSPSLRGSGRFSGTADSTSACPRNVSIPFIAGQWSLRSARPARASARPPRSQSPSLRGSGRFHPPGRTAGQHALVSQSPSLRGSGCFEETWKQEQSKKSRRFNPLHCGAVVASCCCWRASAFHYFVSIPFIAGQWSLQDKELWKDLRA